MKCIINECERQVIARGWCSLHYGRWRANGDPTTTRRAPPGQRPSCKVEGCDRLHNAKGFCVTHYQRWLRSGTADKKTNRGSGRFRSGGGYIYVYRPDHPNASIKGTLPEHRLIMSEHLGRPLLRSEIVHHRNGIKDDNRIENLVIMSRAGHLITHHGDITCPHCGKSFQPD